jgi:hypothetical protein
MKIRPVGDELFHAGGRTDGQTDMTKLIVAFAILRTPLRMSNTKTNFQDAHIPSVPVCGAICMIPVLNYHTLMMHLDKGMEVSSPPIPWYTVNRGKCGESGEERKLISCQEGNPGCPVHITVTIWLSYHGFAKLAYVVDRRANAEISKTRPNSSIDVPILAHSRLTMIRNITT